MTRTSTAPTMSIREMCRAYRVDMPHATHVAGLAVELFMLTQAMHRLNPRLQEVIHAAGLLHNVAYAQGAKGHHKRGRDILLGHSLSDLDDSDRALLAVTTVFHRKRWKPERLEKEPAYLALPHEARPAALMLAALVRIADGLDSSHSQTSQIAACEVHPDRVKVVLAGPFAAADALTADHKADLWRALLDRPVEFVARPTPQSSYVNP